MSYPLSYYYLFSPPYFVLVAGLFIGVTSGLAFQAVLKQSVTAWSRQRQTSILQCIEGISILLPFWGIHLGACLFLESGMQVFGFPAFLGWAIALPLTLGSGGLVWTQLTQMLLQLERGGSKALDLDSLN